MPESRVRTAWRAFLRWLDGPVAGRIAGAGDGLFTLGLLLFFVQLCFRFVALFEVSLQQVPVPGIDMPSRSALELARAVGAVGILLLASVLGAMRAPSYLDHDLTSRLIRILAILWVLLIVFLLLVLFVRLAPFGF